MLDLHEVQALLANSHYLSSDQEDTALIEAINFATSGGKSLTPLALPASGLRPTSLEASESLADAELPPSGPKPCLGSVHPKPSLGLLYQASKVNRLSRST